MSRKDDLDMLGMEISNAQTLARQLGLSLVMHLLAMAHLELIEREEEYNGERNILNVSKSNRGD